MHNLDGTTFLKFASIKLFLSISILLKTMPVFSFAGFRLIRVFKPECKEIPVNETSCDKVFEKSITLEFYT